MGILDWAFKSSKDLGKCALPDTFPLKIASNIFIQSDIVHTYSRILTDTVERVHGIPDKVAPALWDSCLQSDANEGLITLLSRAMSEKVNLYLVWRASVGLLRKATPIEEQKIRADYEKSSKSSVGVFISFKNYHRTDMLEIYSALEYCLLGSLNKTLNLSKAIQVKIDGLRAAIGTPDAELAMTQAKEIAKALGDGFDTMLDAKDIIENAKPDTAPAEKALTLLDSKRAFILSLPLSYNTGLQTTGIGSTGEADARATERGLKGYYVSILKPVLEALFGISTEFKSQDFREIGTAMEVVKTMDLVSDDLISKQSKQEYIARILQLDVKEEQKRIAQESEESPDDAKTNPENAPEPVPQ